MLKVSLLELCFRGVPETLLFIWSINLINTKKMSIKTWIILSAILSLIIYFIRLLPIQFGVNTILAVISLIVSEHYIVKLPLTKAISSSLIVVTLLSVCEFANIIILSYVFKLNLQNIVKVPQTKILTSIPSLILFIVFILIFNAFNQKINAKGTI